MATPTTLPASFTAANVLTAAQMNNLRGAFRVLQVVQGTYATATSNSTTTYADTGLSASITPTDSASKILVIVNHFACYKATGNALSGLNLRLLRGATSLGSYGGGIGYTAVSSEGIHSASIVYLDSPATTSATTYKTQFANNANAASVQVQTSNTTSTITLCEISA